MTPTVEELQPAIEKALGIPKDEILLGFGDDYPECLCMVVLRDVGPSKMERVVRLIEKRIKAGAKLRLCANVVEKKYAGRFKALTWEGAWKHSWDVNCATVRFE